MGVPATAPGTVAPCRRPLVLEVDRELLVPFFTIVFDFVIRFASGVVTRSFLKSIGFTFARTVAGWGPVYLVLSSVPKTVAIKK